MVSPRSASAHPILKLVQKCTSLKTLKQLHTQYITTSLFVYTYPLSKLLLISSSLSVPYSLSIFNRIPTPSVFLYNTLISSIITNNPQSYCIHIAFSLYTQMLYERRVLPNSYTYPSLFKACVSHGWAQFGKTLHAHVLKFLEIPYDNFVQASLVGFYGKFGLVGACRYLFDLIKEPDLASWNSILSAYASVNGYWVDSVVDSKNSDFSLQVFDLFVEMQYSNVMPNEVTMVALIQACANSGSLIQGTWAHGYVLKHDIRFNLFVATALIDMYAKCGRLDLAYQVFDELPSRDVFCYNSMIGGFAIHGCGSKALEMFCRLEVEGLAPDDVTFVVVMCACSHVGLVDEGRRIFLSMKGVYGIEPKLEHYGCLVDLLGRAGQVKEAEEIIGKMPMKPNAVLWRSLLGAARIHGNIEIGEVALRKLIELEPETSGNYVLLSNMYSKINKWDDANKVRSLMKVTKVDKMPGTSLLDVNGVMHEFLTCDRTHPCSKDIYLKLEEINNRLQECGHKPRTKEVLFDIEEEEKEDALTHHSERLALAYALIVSDDGVPIRIIKNLRVCCDCHTIMKHISRIYNREIIVRDRIRFHLFKGGTCSCSDYW